MPTFAIAFIAPEKPGQLIHRIVPGETSKDALRAFFDAELVSHYSNDDRGFAYFKDDFSEEGVGSILACEEPDFAE